MEWNSEIAAMKNKRRPSRTYPEGKMRESRPRRKPPRHFIKENEVADIWKNEMPPRG